MASPFFFVKKKDGALWPVEVYHKLNQIMIKNAYLIPLINEQVDKIHVLRFSPSLTLDGI
jgi:hypothetical protein